MQVRTTDHMGMVVEEVVHAPSHYNHEGMECIDAIRATLTPEEFVGFCKGQVKRYSWRMGHKDALEIEAGKLIWYATWLTGRDPRDG